MSKYYSIAELIRMDIFAKYRTPHQLIPSIRSYSKMYHVNPNTVSRALHLLEKENIIYPYRTKGYYVSEIIQNKKEEYVKAQAEHLVTVLQNLGYSNIEIEKLVINWMQVTEIYV